MIIQIVNTFDSDQKYNSIYSIDSRSRGFTSLDLQMSTNEPHQLNIVANVNLPKKAYDLIAYDKYGLRIIKDGIDLLFVQDESSKKIDSSGNISVRYYSSVYKLFYSEPVLANRKYIEKSAIEILGELDGVDFTLISPDIVITLEAGIYPNLQFIDKIRERTASWSYLDAGLKPRGDGTYGNEIIIGDFTKIDNTEDERFHTEYVRQKSLKTMVLTKSPIIVGNIVTYFNGRRIKYLLPVLTSGQDGGGSNNTSAVFLDTDYDFIDPEFPLVEINGKIYIQDTTFEGIEERFVTYPITIDSNSADQDGNLAASIESAYKNAYRRSVYYLKTQRESKRQDAPILWRKLTFPKYFQVKYRKVIYNIRGEKYVIHDINERKFIDNLQHDLTIL